MLFVGTGHSDPTDSLFLNFGQSTRVSGKKKRGRTEATGVEAELLGNTRAHERPLGLCLVHSLNDGEEARKFG